MDMNTTTLSSAMVGLQRGFERNAWLQSVLRCTKPQKRVKRKHNRLQISINAKRKHKR